MATGGMWSALDPATGKILWSFASGGSVASGPAVADGMVFWGSGYEHLNSPTVHQPVSNDMFYAFEPALLQRTSRSDGP
jgi:polyvinyl alcohol dehydrogenase (cytochrome)